jgi:hypothetical protein
MAKLPAEPAGAGIPGRTARVLSRNQLAWLFDGERPGAATIAGGTAVLGALAYHELAERHR